MDGPHSNNIIIVTDNGNHTSTEQFYYKVCIMWSGNLAHVIFQLADGKVGSSVSIQRSSLRRNGT